MELIKLTIVWLICFSSQSYAVEARLLETPVVINDLIIPYAEFSIYLLPGEKFMVNFKDAVRGGTLSFNGKKASVGENPLIAPADPGNYLLEIMNKVANETSRIHVFVMVPAIRLDKSGSLNGYRIGKYPTELHNGKSIYMPPRGFVEVTEVNSSTRLSPNFTLGQFVSKQEQGYPKYVVLRPRLLLKLEKILAALNRAGHKTEGFIIMSGYRTPWYNRKIGNVKFSRHTWGGAADIYIDENPGDGVMDDLNQDGEINRKDSDWLAKFIDAMSRNGEFHDQIGGLGIYGSNAAHSPFVHVDVRGSRARW